MVPDVIDGLESIAVRGYFQQSIGHPLLGATIVGVPLGLVLTWALRCGMQRLVKLDHTGGFPKVLGRVGRWTRSVDNRCGFESPGQRFGIETFSVWLGALSHVIFDLLSHERSRLLWPFAEDPAWLGSWWTSVWFRVSLPGYPDYPIGPHFVGWLVLSFAGAVMFFRWPPRARG